MGEQVNVKYMFDITYEGFCPGSAGGGGGGGLSDGSILLIVFFVVIVVYFIAGMLFLKFVKKNEGAEIIPNKSFWTALPGLIKDGFLFFFGKCRSLISGN